MIVAHRNAASPSLTSPKLGEGFPLCASSYAIVLAFAGAAQ